MALQPEQHPVLKESARLDWFMEVREMTTPAIAIRNEIRELIHAHIERFGQSAPLTSSELEDCHCRAERIKLLGQELDRVDRMTIVDERFGRAS